MSERYQIERGRSGNGAINYGVQDTMPPLGSDGRHRDYDNESEALEHVTRLNAAFKAESLDKAPHGLQWIWNGRCFWWDRPRAAREAFYD